MLFLWITRCSKLKRDPTDDQAKQDHQQDQIVATK